MTSPRPRLPRARSVVAALALTAAPLALAQSASAQIPAPASSPTLPTTVSSAWTGVSSVPTSSTDRQGLALGVLPSQGLAAFELSYPDGGSSNALAARWQRGGTSPLSVYDDNFDYLESTNFQSSTSAYGTLIGYSFGTGPVDSRASARILRPDGTWERLPQIRGVQDSSNGGVRRTWSLTDSGVAIYTERYTDKLVVYRIAPGATNPQQTMLTVPKARDAVSSAASLPNGDVLLAYSYGPYTAPGAPTAEIANVMRFNSDGNLSAEPLVTLKGRPNASPFDLVAGRDGWSFLLANEVYTKPGGPAELPYLFLHRRTPAGQWETEGIELNVGAQPYIAQSRVLPAAGGAATVLLVLNEMNGIERLAQFEVAADGTASELRTIATGETIRFDVIADADGTQSLVWERVEPSGPQPAGRWTYRGPFTTTDQVAFQSRSAASAAWSDPQLLSKTARLLSPDAEAMLIPRLQRSGKALYAAWYEDRNSGAAAALTTAVTGYSAEQPKPTTPAAPAKPVTQSAAGSRTLKIDAFLRFRSKARACPQSKNIAIAVRKQRANGTLSSRALATESVNLTTKLVSGGCQVTGTVVLKRRQKAGTRAGVTIRALGYRVRAVRITLQ